MTEQLTHLVKFHPGYDCIDFDCRFDSTRCFPGSGGSHGVHGIEIGFYASGEKGTVQFKLSTGWLPQSQPEDKIGYRSLPSVLPKDCASCYPMATDLSYHSKTPMYEGHTPITLTCEFTNNMPCYCDGSGLNANDAFYTLLNGGDEALWRFLDEYYLTVFHNAPYPEVTEYPTAPRAKS